MTLQKAIQHMIDYLKDNGHNPHQILLDPISRERLYEHVTELREHPRFKLWPEYTDDFPFWYYGYQVLVLDCRVDQVGMVIICAEDVELEMDE